MKKENTFTHKFLPILAIFILVSFVFINTSVFAVDSKSVDANGTIYTIPTRY